MLHDYSEFGCEIDGGEGNELAFNEDDGKWLEKTQKAATVKANKKRKVVMQRTMQWRHIQKPTAETPEIYTSASQAGFIGSTTSGEDHPGC